MLSPRVASSRLGRACDECERTNSFSWVLLAIALGRTVRRRSAWLEATAEEWRSIATREEFRLRALRPAVKPNVMAYCERADDDGIVVGSRPRTSRRPWFHGTTIGTKVARPCARGHSPSTLQP